MSKKAMSLLVLVITVVIMIIVVSVTMVSLESTGIIDKAEQAVEGINLKNIQQLANMAYANVYFDNLTKGIRRDLTSEEIRARMIKDGLDEQELDLYEIVVKDGDVYVSIKEEE